MTRHIDNTCRFFRNGFLLTLPHFTPCYSEPRTKTVFSFAQAVYLLFAAVYVCKEAAEHMLLSAGGEEGHHHHPGDENPTSGYALHGSIALCHKLI